MVGVVAKNGGWLYSSPAFPPANLLTRPMNCLSFVLNSIVGLVAGAVVRSFGGRVLRWLLALGYHRQGPSDPADAPVYVLIGLVMLGAFRGAVARFVVGIVAPHVGAFSSRDGT